jgi:hypothetical protein
MVEVVFDRIYKIFPRLTCESWQNLVNPVQTKLLAVGALVS